MGASGQLHVQAVLPRGEKPPVLIQQEDGWAPEPVWTFGEAMLSFQCPDWNCVSSRVHAAAQLLYRPSPSGSTADQNKQKGNPRDSFHNKLPILRSFYTSKLDSDLRKKTSKVPHLSQSFLTLRNIDQKFLISNFRRVLYVVCFLLGNSPASEFYMPTFRNTMSVPSS